MFGKKKYEAPKSSAWDIEYKQLHGELFSTRKKLESYIRNVMVHEGCANCLPDGADKNVELQEAKKYREFIRNILSSYDDTRRKLLNINHSDLVVCKDWILPEDSHTCLNRAYRTVMNLWDKA